MSERSERQHNNFTFLSLCYTWANFSVSFGTLPLVESATSLLFQILNRIFEIDIHRFSIIRFVSPIMAFVVAKIPVAIAKKLPQWMVLPTPLFFVRRVLFCIEKASNIFDIVKTFCRQYAPTLLVLSFLSIVFSPICAYEKAKDFK